MLLRNTSERFGAIAKAFHWVLAILVIMVLMIGYRMEQMESVDRVFVMFYHKSFGVLVLILMTARMLWRFISPRPARLPTVKPWEDHLATLVHFMLYAAVLAMPITGWVMSSAGEYPVSFFGLFTLPQIVPKNAEIMGGARAAHGLIAIGIIVLLFLHFSGAAKHHVIDRDNTLRRMTWDRMGFVGGLVVLALGLMLYLLPVSGFITNLLNEEDELQEAAASIVIPPQVVVPFVPEQNVLSMWNVDAVNSVIKFKATQSGQAFEGEFKNFKADIVFDPTTTSGKIDVAVPIANFSSGSSERDTEVLKPAWFDASSFPEARYTADSFTYVVGGEYVAHGTLMIRGVSKALDLPFKFNSAVVDGVETATVEGGASINRLDYGIGQGEWQKTDTVADSVEISIYVKATRPVAPSIGVSE